MHAQSRPSQANGPKSPDPLPSQRVWGLGMWPRTCMHTHQIHIHTSLSWYTHQMYKSFWRMNWSPSATTLWPDMLLNLHMESTSTHRTSKNVLKVEQKHAQNLLHTMYQLRLLTCHYQKFLFHPQVAFLVTRLHGWASLGTLQNARYQFFDTTTIERLLAVLPSVYFQLLMEWPIQH